VNVDFIIPPEGDARKIGRIRRDSNSGSR